MWNAGKSSPGGRIQVLVLPSGRVFLAPPSECLVGTSRLVRGHQRQAAASTPGSVSHTTILVPVTSHSEEAPAHLVLPSPNQHSQSIPRESLQCRQTDSCAHLSPSNIVFTLQSNAALSFALLLRRRLCWEGFNLQAGMEAV